MSALYREYLEDADFGSYEDFLRNFRLKTPENFNFAYDVLDRIAKEEPEKRALVWHTPEGETKEFTFGQISALSDRAAAMLSRMGVKKGEKIMLVLKRHYSFWYIIMALHKIGAVTVPATNLLTKKDIVYRANAADIKGVIATGHGAFPGYAEEALPECPSVEFLMMVGEQREGWLSFEEEMEKPAEPFAPLRRPTCNDDILLLYFTSGTSGMPKMVAHDFLYPLGHIQTAVFWHQCQENGLHLTVAETGWAKSVWGKLYGQWLAGCAVMAYDFDKFVPSEILGVIARFGVTSFCAPPTIYRFMMTEEMEKYDLSSLKHCTIAGEALNPEVYQQWLKRTGLEMRESYGQTELCVAVCTFPWMKASPGSMGKPSPMFDMDIVDEEGASCPPGVVGEMVIRTRRGKPVGMFQGYYRDRERTEGVWHDGLYHTLDLAWRDEWGYYWYVGRADDVIKSSGYRIGPFEVESALMEHPAVLETAITGVPDPVRGQIVKATIVLNKGYEPSDALKKELQDHVKRATAPYKYPRVIEFVDELPKTISGKIRRVEIREREQNKQNG
ncbi:MAG: AMP-binding protein [Eubacteriales bacterium]|nr:AMP-binding protein [Eubacteriales bacterium]